MKINVKGKIKKAAAALFAFAVISAGALDAKAVELGPSELLFALYGNTTEYMTSLGPVSSLLAPGSTTNIAISASDLTAVSGTNSVKWAIWGWDYDPDTSLATSTWVSMTQDPATFTPLQQNGVDNAGLWNTATSLWGQTTGQGGPNLVADTNPNSFTSWFGTTGTMNGAYPASAEGGLGSTVGIAEGDFNTTALWLVGQASMSLDGLTLTLSGPVPSVVPIPASVVLFATGLAGLVGVARRKLMTV